MVVSFRIGPRAHGRDEDRAQDSLAAGYLMAHQVVSRATLPVLLNRRGIDGIPARILITVPFQVATSPTPSVPCRV